MSSSGPDPPPTSTHPVTSTSSTNTTSSSTTSPNRFANPHATTKKSPLNPFSRLPRTFTPRTLTAPLAALIMAGLLYTYSITSIRAAKRNAQLHREADGGQLDMRRESLRRHGVLEQVQGTRGMELFAQRSEAEKVRGEGAMMGEKKAGPLRRIQGLVGEEREVEEGKARTQVEGELEGYKGRELVKRIREEREGG